MVSETLSVPLNRTRAARELQGAAIYLGEVEGGRENIRDRLFPQIYGEVKYICGE